MIRAVLDINVLASGSTSSTGWSGQVLAAWRQGAFALVTSEHILVGLAEALEGRYFRKKLSRRKRLGVVARVRRVGQVVEITVQVAGVAPDEEDDQVLATARTEKVPYLVTEDAEFLKVKEFRGTSIVSPQEFLRVLADQAKGGDPV